MPGVLLFHPGLLICLIVLSLVWPFGLIPAAVCAVLLLAAYAYLVIVPLRVSRFTQQPRRLPLTLGLLVSLAATLVLFLLLMERWDASLALRWPVAFVASYYAGALLTTVLLLGLPRGKATRP
jgi:hypothetical protein